MDNPFMADLPIEEQIANVRQALDAALTELATHGKTEQDAEHLMKAHFSYSWTLAKPWYGAAYNAVSARAQLSELEEQAQENERHDEPKYRSVKWRNLWNWTSEEGGTTRMHLTGSEGLSGTTLCGREFPDSKGYPTAVRYCKTCVKKSKMTVEQIKELEYVPSSAE